MWGGCCCTNEDDTGDAAIESLRDSLSEAHGEPQSIFETRMSASEERSAIPHEGARSDTAASVDAAFTITLVKETAESAIGAGLETWGGLAMVSTISDGPVSEYNQSAPLDLQVKQGDLLIRVDSKQGTIEELVAASSDSEVVQLTFHRPLEITVKLDKRKCAGEVGLDLAYMTNSTSLLITLVKPGLVQEWNAHKRFQQVNAGDRILAVNGSQASAKRLLQICRDSMDLELSIICAAR